MEVKDLERTQQIEHFIDTLFQGDEGWVYAPTKRKRDKSKNDSVFPKWFKWPENRQALVTHIFDRSAFENVHIAPSLFNKPPTETTGARTENWRGSRWVWVDFDGNAPNPNALQNKIPQPTMRLQSSVPTNQHWYWRLSEFETNIDLLQAATRNLTYQLDADKGGWDATQFLRPVGSVNRDKNNRPVTLLESNSEIFEIVLFAKDLIFENPVKIVEWDEKELDTIEEVLSRYAFDDRALETFSKSAPKDRSMEMWWLANYAYETVNIEDKDLFVFLRDLDNRWHKFSERGIHGQRKELLGLIFKAKKRQSEKSAKRPNDPIQIQSYGEYEDEKIKPAKWLFEGFLMDPGLTILASAPGIGKTRLALQLCFSASAGNRFLHWEYGLAGGVGALFISLEMGKSKLRRFTDLMQRDFGKAMHRDVRERMQVAARGYALSLFDHANMEQIFEVIQNRDIKIVVIDSAKAAAGDMDRTKIDRFYNDFIIAGLQERLKVSVIVLHHLRKPDKATPTKKPQGLAELYGDQYHSAYADNVIGLWRYPDRVVETIIWKSRFGENEGESYYLKNSPSGSGLFVPSDLPSIPEPEVKSKRQAPSKSKSKDENGNIFEL